MSKLNKIFYGPAGTGKTREAILEAVKVVNEKVSDVINMNDYSNTYTFFKKFSSYPKLPQGIKNTELIKKIQDNNSEIEKIISDDKNEGQLKYLCANELFNKNDSEKAIQEYRNKCFSSPFIEIVTFHPSYSYQDFVEGISVETTNNNQILYKPKDGIFKKICERAKNNTNFNYVLIIDEINRGDISSIFGELFTLLENSKREGNQEELAINLPYSKDEQGNPKKLKVPNNLYILATMNTVDKSIALIDIALRRRFEFIECKPKYDIDELKKFADVDLSLLLKTINERLTILKNEHFQIGHSYFLNIENIEKLREVFKNDIVPLLQEYFYDDWQSICAVLNQSYNKSPSKEGILILDSNNDKIFAEEFKDLIDFKNKKVFKLNEKFEVNDIQKIYTM